MIGRIWRMGVLSGLTGLAFVGAAVGGGRTAWFVFGCLAGLTALGLVAGFAVRGRVTVERVMPGAVLHAGDTLRVEGTVRLPFRFPLVFVLVADAWRNERTGRTVKGVFLLAPMGRTSLPFSYGIRGLDRGVYRLEETVVRAVDFFDLANHRCKWSPADAAAGDRQPFAEEPGRRDGPNGRDPSGQAGQRGDASLRFTVGPVRTALSEWDGEPARRADPVAAGGVRLYAEGDPVGRIDWRTSMRTGRLMVKTPDPDDGWTVGVRIDPGADQAGFERALGAAAAFFRARRDEGMCGGSQAPDVVLEGEEGGETSLLRDGGEAVIRRLALLDRERLSAGSAASPGSEEAVPLRGERWFLLATGRMDRALADEAMRLAAAGPVRVLAALPGPPGEAEWLLVQRLEAAGIGVAFAQAAKPACSAGESAARGDRGDGEALAV